MALDITPHGAVQVESVVNGPIETNTYFLGCDGMWIVIDPAWEGEKLVEHFRSSHPAATLLGAVCTHGHADHVGGVSGVRRELGDDASFELSAKDVDTAKANIREQREMWGIETPDPGEPTRLLAEGDTVEVGSAVLQVIETPGHTPGGVVLFAATDGGDIAFVGDTLFPSGHGRTDLTGGNEVDMMHSLAKLGRLLPPETLCYTGHGPTTTMEQELANNPFMKWACKRYNK